MDRERMKVKRDALSDIMIGLRTMEKEHPNNGYVVVTNDDLYVYTEKGFMPRIPRHYAKAKVFNSQEEAKEEVVKLPNGVSVARIEKAYKYINRTCHFIEHEIECLGKRLNGHRPVYVITVEKDDGNESSTEVYKKLFEDYMQACFKADELALSNRKDFIDNGFDPDNDNEASEWYQSFGFNNFYFYISVEERTMAYDEYEI